MHLTRIAEPQENALGFPSFRAYSSTVRAGDSSKGAAGQEWPDGNGMNSGKPQRRSRDDRTVAILSQAGGTPPEGAETTWGLQCP